jgi:cytidylate kinase
MVIAIDGPAGSGKSTIAKLLAQKLKDGEGRSFTYINSGNLYRAITLGCLRAGITPNDSAAALEYAEKAKIAYDGDKIILDGEDVTDILHTDEIDRWSAPLSAIVPIRHVVNDIIRDISKGINAVAEGRDMTTVVFTDAEHRFYLDASVEARAKRRFDQGVSKLSLEEIKETISQRDAIDKNKKEGSLAIAAGVEYIDTSGLTINQVYAILEGKIKEDKPITRNDYGADGSGIAII